MKMKRVFAFALMVMLLCLPVWAMAECPFTVKDADGNILNVGPDPDGIAPASWSSGNKILRIKTSGLTVSGGAPGASIVILNGDNVTLENVTISGLDSNVAPGAILAQGVISSAPVTLIFKGENSLTSTQFGIWYGSQTTSINIQMTEGSKLTINAQEPIGNATEYPTIASVSAVDITSGSGTIIVNGNTVYPIPKPASNDLPQTGDDSNVILWFALACISLLGMTMLAYKRKEA